MNVDSLEEQEEAGAHLKH
ncbi:hypothetical protein J003_06710 [Cryptococcus neoformans]|nr:hypothetical protein J009_06708 [Cryptococcus neoformans var. grubii]OXH41809.1 hypothetical protein J004_06755 [Cryptococcus neoformans var. grubii]OXH42717.1 hypothetical protein J003_06710 [Cryptococcus neoformans var. grubii]OXH44071.1 hypothetical protein J002_06713 [Cryptococcus neoformans var. grubii]OXH62251.1 hypothetical protein J001_06705 [Cryptococcus neoformans var. grubii]